VRSQKQESEHRITFQKVVGNGRFRWIIFRTVKGNCCWTLDPEDFGQCVCPVVAEVIGDDLDSRREIRWHCALGSFLEFGDCVHKSTRNVEWRHADVDVKHDLSEGGAGGGVESLEGEKHPTEVILAILFPREKIPILPGSNCYSGGAPLDDEVKGRDKGLEIPRPLGQVGTTISVQNGIGMTLQK